MKLFEVSIRFTAKKTDTNYIIRNYAVIAPTKVDAYQLIMNKHLDETHLIIDINVQEELKGWISLYPDVDTELEGDYAAKSAAIQKWQRERRSPTWFYLLITIVSVYILIGMIIVNTVR